MKIHEPMGVNFTETTDSPRITVYCIALGYIPDGSVCLLFYEIGGEVSVHSDIAVQQQKFAFVFRCAKILKCAFSTIMLQFLLVL